MLHPNHKPTIKFLCSYRGKILPRYPDRKLYYHGGETRVLVVDRSISFSELSLKMGEMCGTSVSLRCQLPTEDLDALVSITSDEELAYLIEEYDRLASPASFLKIRAFLGMPKSTTKSISLSSSSLSLSSTSSSNSSSSSSTPRSSCVRHIPRTPPSLFLLAPPRNQPQTIFLAMVIVFIMATIFRFTLELETLAIAIAGTSIINCSPILNWRRPIRRVLSIKEEPENANLYDVFETVDSLMSAFDGQ